MKRFQRIMVATDFSACADAAAAVAVQLALQLNAMVDVVTVVDTSALLDAYGNTPFRAQRIDQIRAQARQRAKDFAERHFGEVEDLRVHVMDGANTCHEIVRAGQELACDLIVMGTHGTTGLAHLVIGSVAEKVVRGSTIPVVTVRGPLAGATAVPADE